MDYSNPRIADFQNVHNHHKSLIDREQTPRMAWHDVGIMLEGESVKDLARHFIQYWNFVNFDLRPREDREFLMVNRESEKLSIQINPIVIFLF